MRFEQPWWLLLIPVALLSVGASYFLGEPRRAALLFPDSAKISELGSRNFWARFLPYLLKASALILCGIAMARPQSVVRQEDNSAQGIDILLVLDTSTSMRAIDFDPMDRIGAAKETVKRFIGGRLHDRIGILVFGGAPVLTCPLTTDYSSLLEFLGQVDAGMTETDGTAIGDAIASAADHLKTSKAKSRIIVLLTDGANNAGVIDPITASKMAASFGIKIYTIGTAKRGEAFVPVNTQFGRALTKIPDELNEDELLQIANATGGQYFRATSLQELSSIYAEIDKLEKSEVAQPPISSYKDLYAWALVPAIAILMAGMILSETVLARIP